MLMLVDLLPAVGDLVAPRTMCSVGCVWDTSTQRDGGSAARTRRVGVGHTSMSFFGEDAFCGVSSVKENPGIFRKREAGSCSVLTAQYCYSDFFQLCA